MSYQQNKIVIKHLRQKMSDDCAVACLSMITGIPYVDVKRELEYDGATFPLSFEYAVRLLTRHNFYIAKE